MKWRRLAAMTAAALLSIHACRVYDESDTKGSDGIDGRPTGGRATTGTGGAPPPFVGNPTGGLDTGSGAKGGASAGASGGRPQGAPASGGTATGATGQGGEPDPSGGDPGATPQGGSQEPGDGGADNTAGTPSAQGGSGSSGAPSGGIGGTPTGGTSTGGASVAPEIIDQGEDGNNQVVVHQGRNGYWSTFEAGAGCELTPPAAPNSQMASMFMSATSAGTGTGNRALHFTSAEGAADSCGVGLELVRPVQNAKQMYDASDYTGIGFGAKAVGGNQNILLKVIVAATDPAFEECDADAEPDSQMQCYDHFRVSLTITGTWQEHNVPFANLEQVGWGYPAGAFDASEVVGIQWVLEDSGAGELWIDDVKFVAE